MDLTKYGPSPYAAGSPLRGDNNTSALGDSLYYLRTGRGVAPDTLVKDTYVDLLRKRNLLPL